MVTVSGRGDDHRYRVQYCTRKTANATIAFYMSAFVPRLEQPIDDGHTYVALTEGVRKDRHRGTEEADTVRPATPVGR